MRKKEKITLCDYIASQSPNEAYQVLLESGYSFEKPRTTDELATILKKYISLDREAALERLSEIHPDKDLLEKFEKEEPAMHYQGNRMDEQYGRYYENPFNKTPFRAGAPTMMYQNFCPSCGYNSFSHNFLNANGCGCGCGGGCGGSKSLAANGDGDSKTNNLILLICGFVVMYFIIAETKGKGVKS